MPNKEFYKRMGSLIVIILMGVIGVNYWYNVGVSYYDKEVISSIRVNIDVKNITSIEYQEIRESYGQGDGKDVVKKNIIYAYPDKLRIETIGEYKLTEIYNNDRFFSYDESKKRIVIKECFPPDKPYITEIESKMSKILNSGEYEFFGYEEKDNKRIEVIGVKTKMDGHNYMHKLWITDIDEIVLPIKEEYFIDNTVVSKTTYFYYKINKPINPAMFSISSLPEAEIVYDGVVSKFVDSYKDAQKYLKFKLILTDKIPEGFIPSEIAVIPPVSNPYFYCIYFKNGYRIYLTEKIKDDKIIGNGYLGKLPCQVNKWKDKITLRWFQNGVFITLQGDEAVLKDVIYFAEQLSGGKFIE